MKPWRAALTSATASGKSTRIASRSATACSSALPEGWSWERAAPVSSTAVFSVSVANCSRCASCTVSACCSANSRRPRRRSSGSPWNGNPKPPSMPSRIGTQTPPRRRQNPADLPSRVTAVYEAAAERDWPRMDPPNVLWFFGAFAIELAVYGLIETIPDSQDGLWRLVTAVGFFIAFAALSSALLRRVWWVPGGLAAALAVATFPAVAVGFLQLVEVWPDRSFFEPFSDFSGYWFGVAIATVVVGLIAFSLTRFPFVLAVTIAAVVIGSQLLVPGFT